MLNSDTETSLKEIKRLVLSAQKEHYLVAAPKLINSDGSAQDTVGYFDSFSKSIINYIFARPRFINVSSVRHILNVDLATGAALLIHTSVFKKIGTLSEDYFMYFEDIDFCARLHANAISILFDPAVTITHLNGGTSDRNLSQKNKNYTAALNTYLTKHRGTLIPSINKIFGFLT